MHARNRTIELRPGRHGNIFLAFNWTLKVLSSQITKESYRVSPLSLDFKIQAHKSIFYNCKILFIAIDSALQCYEV